MSKEIERKFIVRNVDDVYFNGYATSVEIEQGYITNSESDIELRIRRKGRKYYQTIKSSGNLIRDEVEIEISKKQFKKLWHLTENRRVSKVRYYIPYEEYTIELDIYGGGLKDLVVAEVEFSSEEESQEFIVPEWFDTEVTNNVKYKNKCLAETKTVEPV